MYCRNCGKEVVGNEEFCPDCKEKQVKSDTMICPFCGKETSKNAMFCQHCDGLVNKPHGTQKPKTQTAPTTKFCKACGSKITKSATYCPNCHKLADVDPVPQPTTYAALTSTAIGFLLGFLLGAIGMIVTLCVGDTNVKESAVKGFFTSLLVAIVLTLVISCVTCGMLPNMFP